MAAYAALVSLMNTMDKILNHPLLSISLDKYQIESLGKKIDFLLGFIESYNSLGGNKEVEALESQIASAAHAAEDVIESHVVDQILARSTEKGPSFLLDLQQIIQGIDSIEEKVTKVKEERRFEDQKSTYSMPAASSRPLTAGKTTMVGFDDELIQLMDVLTRQQSDLQIIPIIGMGGMGKTTLARNVYENLLIVQHFDIRAWVTVSQEYNVRKILFDALSCLSESTSEMDEKTEEQLGEQLYKILNGRRYLIILDDLWSIEAWDKIKFFFPKNCNRSRIIVTTRLSDVVNDFGSLRLVLNLLDGDKSWDLFCEKAFAQETCPPELEEIGKNIVKKCKGLPLSIVVIGGLLGKSSRTREYWESVARDTNSNLKSEKDEQCLNILSLSYNHLPAHLKACFLYMGIFPEDCVIRVSRLIKVWVAEGFLKPNKSQNLEEVAEDYLKDLVDRNLIFVSRWRWNGTIKYCNIHDLLRELCLRIAEKEKFLYMMRVPDIPRGVDRERRIVIHESIPEEYHPRVLRNSPSASLARSFIFKGGPLPFRFPLLRVLTMAKSDSLEAIFQQVNLRYLLYKPYGILKPELPPKLPPSISLLWNVQTLIIRGDTERIIAPSEIWYMRQLRHLDFNEIFLLDPPPSDTVDQQDDIVLRNLQTLCNIVNFRLSEEVCRRIPNIKKLHLRYEDFSGECLTNYYCFNNLGRLHKLQSLNCLFYEDPKWGDLLENLTFPSSLRKLSLRNSCLHWEDVTMIGLSLPHLEVLKLSERSVVGPEWNPVDGAFPHLKFLRICCEDLIYWNADNSHFPVLEKLVLDNLEKLDGIPLGMGEILTLRYLRLYSCSESAAISSTKILEEQINLGNGDLEVRVKFRDTKEEESFMEKVEMSELFTRKNFQHTATFDFLDLHLTVTKVRAFHPRVTESLVNDTTNEIQHANNTSKEIHQA